jgi:hypothetical protein
MRANAAQVTLEFKLGWSGKIQLPAALNMRKDDLLIGIISQANVAIRAHSEPRQQRS